MKSRYYFSYCYDRCMKVEYSSWCSLHYWYSYQLSSFKWFCPLSHSNLTIFSSSLNRVSINTLL